MAIFNSYVGSPEGIFYFVGDAMTWSIVKQPDDFGWQLMHVFPGSQQAYCTKSHPCRLGEGTWTLPVQGVVVGHGRAVIRLGG